MISRLFVLIFGVSVLFIPLVSPAVVFYSTGDPSYNSTAPTGDLEGSGWQFQGTFNSYLGTPIAPHHFITASHFGGTVGDTFTYNGIAYTTIAKLKDPDSDLILWEVSGTFPSYAPLYTSSDEAGKDLMVFGRGWDRGDEVLVNGELRGWKWGSNTKVQRWGQNVVSGVVNYPSYGDLLVAEFNNGAGTNECMLSGGDSGGGVFIQSDGIWKLAGINLSVSPSSFSYDSSGTAAFNATLFDYCRSGRTIYDFYYYTGSTWTTAYANGQDIPCKFLSTRISSCYGWITNNIPDFDQDVDGMPDWYEIMYGGDATSMIATNDSDGDGFSNYIEWLADTIPTDTNSHFSMGISSNATQLSFTGSSNRIYQVQYRLDLVNTNESWQTEHEWFVGTSPQSIKEIQGPVSNRFYRVGVKVR
ncbi:MAG: hypothetical protein JXR25_10875 [Pontiellaceae bacterium]|nr:hypothetical protein [Pontiellaceae bacterium]MBN2785323.1 hypothetical protein [Pontiellaceae bacterium]